MRLTVFGPNGGTGRLVVRQALDAGHQAVAVTRHPTTRVVACSSNPPLVSLEGLAPDHLP
jgi:putative NADH-flavin reductase